MARRRVKEVEREEGEETLPSFSVVGEGIVRQGAKEQCMKRNGIALRWIKSEVK
jgi:hypothetical protein